VHTKQIVNVDVSIELWTSFATVCYVAWNLFGHEDSRKKEVGVAAPVTSPTHPLLARWRLTSTRSQAYVTRAHSVGVCFVDGGIVAVTSVSRSAGLEHLLLVRCVRHTLMRQSTVEALGWQVMVDCVIFWCRKSCWNSKQIDKRYRHWQRYSLTKAWRATTAYITTSVNLTW